MATIVTRASKGSALSFAEGDANFTNLNDAKVESTDVLEIVVLTQSQYDALNPPVSTTLYLIEEE